MDKKKKAYICSSSRVILTVSSLNSEHYIDNTCEISVP